MREETDSTPAAQSNRGGAGARGLRAGTSWLSSRPEIRHREKRPEARMSIDAPEIIMVTTRRVSCDGGGGALGHPRVWYEIGEDGYVECGYCDRKFVLKGGPADTGEHG